MPRLEEEGRFMDVGEEQFQRWERLLIELFIWLRVWEVIGQGTVSGIESINRGG